jgi:hypothetical protein
LRHVGPSTALLANASAAKDILVRFHGAGPQWTICAKQGLDDAIEEMSKLRRLSPI